jgi:hypothetical protein
MLRKIGSSVRGRAMRDGEPAVDQRLHDLPEEVGDQEDDDGAQRTAHEPVHHRVAPGELGEVNLPEAGEEECRREDQERAEAALNVNRGEARAPRRRHVVVGWAKEMRGRAVHNREGHRQRERHDCDRKQPPHPHHPQEPDCHEVRREEPVEGLPMPPAWSRLDPGRP